MINLIPNEEKKKMSKDFYLRLLTVIFLMLSASLFVASVAILPSYLFSYIEKESINEAIEIQKNEPISLPDQNTLVVVKNLENQLSLIENVKKNKFIFSQEIINKIISKKIPDIKITQIFYQNDSQTGKKVNISGRAPSREILLSFRRALEDGPSFFKVDLPISNFVKGSNIKFYLSLTPS